MSPLLSFIKPVSPPKVKKKRANPSAALAQQPAKAA